jgi:nucleoside-diphosphate-sugar epimerase
MAMSKILVTGSSGTIGTRLCERLLEMGFGVTGLDLRKNKWVKKVDGITVIGDVLDKKTFETLDKDFDVVIHLAAHARVYNLVLDPEKAMENLRGVFNVLEFCRKNKIKRFIFASSREVYGNAKKIRYSEVDAHFDNCESPYTASKIGGEALVNAYRRCYGIGCIIIRFSNVYGMYDETDRVVPLFIRLAKEGKDLVVFGKGKTLDFTYIDDAVSGVIKCVEKFDGAKNAVYNIGSGKATRIRDVASMIRKMMNGKNRILIKGNRTGEVEKFEASISRSERVLGYKPKTPLREGIEKSIEWYAEYLR